MLAAKALFITSSTALSFRPGIWPRAVTSRVKSESGMSWKRGLWGGPGGKLPGC